MAEILPAQIDYTSRDYASLREDLLARVRTAVPEWQGTDPADFGVVMLEAFAHLGDIMSYYIDRAANESSLSTATKRSSVLALARDLGYDPSGFTAATVTISFANSSASPVTIPKSTTITASVTKEDAVLFIPFETDSEITVAGSSAGTVTATQGTTVTGTGGYGESIGVSDGTPSQFMRLSSDSVVKSTVQVYVYDGVNYYPWTQVSNLIDFTPTSKVFRVYDDGYNGFFVEFGDGVSGATPSQGHVVYATYREVDGLNGNVAPGTITEITAVPGLTPAQVAVLVGTLTVTNDAAATGGSDPEDLAAVRKNAAQAYRSNNRAVTVEDYQNLALQVPGVGKASARSTVPTSVLLTIAPSRNITAAETRPGYFYNGSAWVTTTEYLTLKSEAYDYVNSRRLAGISLTMTDPVYTDIVVAMSVTSLSSVMNADVQTIVKQAIADRFDYSNVGFGASVTTSDLIALVSSLGVSQSATVTVLKKSGQPDAVTNLIATEDEIFLLSESNITITATGGAG